jgi:hypothetical protein
MRPKIAVWSDYGSPGRKRWRSPRRRNTRSAIGLKILLVAVVSVAGVVGISGIYPQIIDSEWVQKARTHAKKTAVAEATTTRRSGLVTAIPLSPRYAATTTGEAEASVPRAMPPAPAVAEPPKVRSAVAAVELPPNETAPPVADMPDAPAVAAPSAEPAPAATAAVRPAQRYVARAPVVKKRVARTEHRRSHSEAYAQYGGGWGGGWGGYRGGWPGLGSPYHF